MVKNSTVIRFVLSIILMMPLRVYSNQDKQPAESEQKTSQYAFMKKSFWTKKKIAAVSAAVASALVSIGAVIYVVYSRPLVFTPEEREAEQISTDHAEKIYHDYQTRLRKQFFPVSIESGEREPISLEKFWEEQKKRRLPEERKEEQKEDETEEQTEEQKEKQKKDKKTIRTLNGQELIEIQQLARKNALKFIANQRNYERYLSKLKKCKEDLIVCIDKEVKPYAPDLAIVMKRDVYIKMNESFAEISLMTIEQIKEKVSRDP